MAKKIRKLKVYSQGDPWRRTEQPQIRFGGKWLRDAGFQPHQPYQITIHAPGALTLTARPEAASHEAVIAGARCEPKAARWNREPRSGHEAVSEAERNEP